MQTHAKQDRRTQKEHGRKRGNANIRVEGQGRGRLGQTMGLGRNGRQERMYGVDKMDAEGNSKEGKLGIWVWLKRV